MPYIPKKERVGPGLREVGYYLPMHIGGLTYMITQLCVDYLESVAEDGYQGLNEIMGALECAKLEFYRRALAPYEDKKIKENGDVF